MEFRLFHKLSSELNLVQNSKVEEIEDDSEEDIEDENNILDTNCDLNLNPFSSFRKNSCHQKAVISLPIKKIENPLSLILFNKNRWINMNDYKQSYCISLLIKHDAEIDLYNQIRTQNQVRARVRN